MVTLSSLREGNQIFVIRNKPGEEDMLSVLGNVMKNFLLVLKIDGIVMKMMLVGTVRVGSLRMRLMRLRVYEENQGSPFHVREMHHPVKISPEQM